jgi:HSP20 family protein
MTMTIRDLIPWNRGRDVAVHRGENANSLLTLHREMNRVFDDVFRGFDVAPFGSDRLFDRTLGWPNIEVSETLPKSAKAQEKVKRIAINGE